jgi:5-bromo-4-chloroindolyl phosphate hydrolysis protein
MRKPKAEQGSKYRVNITGNVISAIIGGMVFAFFLLVLNAGIILSLVVGISGFGAGLLIFTSKKMDKTLMDAHLRGITEETLKITLEVGYWKLAEIRACARKTKDKIICQKIEDIGNTVAEIFENFKKDPKDIKTARPFLNYHLDAAIKVIQKYSQLSERQVQSADMQKTLKKAESLLDNIGKAFKKQLAKLLEDDVMDLDIEVELLKKTLKMEGLEEN